MTRRDSRVWILAALMLSMALTRYHHFLPVPDASWALYFIGGYYLRGWSRWAFPLLMVEAVAIDWVATQKLGVSSYCITAAYAFLVPTHAVLWSGGWWLRKRATPNLGGGAALFASTLLSTTLAYLISNASFYFLGGRHPNPSLAEYPAHFLSYFGHFLSVTAIYVAAVALVHVIAVRLFARTDEVQS